MQCDFKGMLLKREKCLTLQDVLTMAPYVTSSMSDGNLSQVRDGDHPGTVMENNNSNNNNNNYYGNNRVGNAISAGNISKIQKSKVKGNSN